MLRARVSLIELSLQWDSVHGESRGSACWRQLVAHREAAGAESHCWACADDVIVCVDTLSLQEEIVYAVDYNPKNDTHLNRAVLADFR